MNLHEYQSKQLLSKAGVIIPTGRIISSADEAEEAAKAISNETKATTFVVKAQIHAGGRGKGGGVKIAKSMASVKDYASSIIGMQLVTKQTGKEGKLVRKVLIEQGIYYPGPTEVEEFYFSILLHRPTGKNMIVYSTEGGMDIEEVAEKTPEKIYKELIDPLTGITDFQCRRIAFNLDLQGKAFKNMLTSAKNIYQAYIDNDASLIEINPLMKTSDEKIVAVDSKVTIDNNALHRHKDIEAMRDVHEENPTELEAGKYNLNYIKLAGNVGCMVNGAGLAMATMDIIKLSGGEPANFLDVGGSANAERVEAGFRIILQDPSVKAILVNIFGGIVRCDRVAKGIIEAYKNIGNINIPIIVRLQGTNADEAQELISNSGLEVVSVIKLEEAAEMVTKAVAF